MVRIGRIRGGEKGGWKRVKEGEGEREWDENLCETNWNIGTPSNPLATVKRLLQ